MGQMEIVLETFEFAHGPADGDGTVDGAADGALEGALVGAADCEGGTGGGSRVEAPSSNKEIGMVEII